MMRYIPMLCVLLLPAGLSAETNWARHEVYSGVRVNNSVASDYDGDGQQDIIIAVEGKIFMKHGQGHTKTFIMAEMPKQKSIPINQKQRPRDNSIHSTLMDVDQDGDLDFVGSALPIIFWLECPNESPTTTPWTFHVVTDRLFGSHCVRAFDIDGDGQEELIANNFLPKGDWPNSVVVLQQTIKVKNNKKDISWTHHPIADKDAMGGSHYFDFADINGDGVMDMAMGAKGKPFKDGDYFSYWLGNKKDILKPWTKYRLPEYGKLPGATHATPVDVNHDGLIDIIATQGHGVGVMWYEQESSGGEIRWIKHMIDDTIDSTHSTDVGDIDGDGDADISTCGYKSKLAVWYENDGNGQFTRHVLSDNQMAYDTMITDINGDGHKDILIAGQASNNVVWFENPGK